MKDSLANRYAIALYSLAKDKKKTLEYQKEIKVLITLFSDNNELLNLFNSSFISLEERKSKVDLIFKDVSLDIKNLLKVVIDNKRASEMLNILKAFNTLVNEENGIVEGILYSALDLSSKQISSLESAISKKENRKVELSLRIDPSLIGGVKIVIEDKVYDGSILAKIESLHENLIKGGK